jgi:hypothetical protein
LGSGKARPPTGSPTLLTHEIVPLDGRFGRALPGEVGQGVLLAQAPDASQALNPLHCVARLRRGIALAAGTISIT